MGTDLVPDRPFMPGRPAVPLTSPRYIPNSSLFCFFCTPVQKSEAHPLPLQSLPASLQKPRVCRHKRFLISREEPLALVPFPLIFCTSHHQIEAHPLSPQPLPHSYTKTPGCHPARFPFSPDSFGVPFNSSTLNLELAFNPFRMNTCKSVSKQSTLTPFRINTYTKPGGGSSSSRVVRTGGIPDKSDREHR